MAISKSDKDIIRELGKKFVEIAALPVQQETIKAWKALNGLKPVRPMVMIDQVCWNEMNVNGELDLKCVDEECRRYERFLRRMMYQWNHFRVDMVVEPFIRVPKAIRNTGLGLAVHDEVAVSDPTNSVVGHKFENQLANDEDLEKIKMPQVSHDAAETQRRMSVAHELFDGLLEVRAEGANLYLSIWDLISQWMGVENALYAIVDRLEFIHRLVERMTQGYLSMVEQHEQQGLLCRPQSIIHCTGAWTDELPAAGYNPDKPRAKDIWMFGLAQMFSTVSPAMFKDLEVAYTSRICQRFGMVYYGCCDPLDLKMAEVKMIPNVRKISMSPWANQDRGAAEIGKKYVFSRKPSPALVATETWHPEAVEEDLKATLSVCAKYGCPVELILKDISTVRYQPQRLWEWAEIAARLVRQ